MTRSYPAVILDVLYFLQDLKCIQVSHRIVLHHNSTTRSLSSGSLINQGNPTTSSLVRSYCPWGKTCKPSPFKSCFSYGVFHTIPKDLYIKKPFQVSVPILYCNTITPRKSTNFSEFIEIGPSDCSMFNFLWSKKMYGEVICFEIYVIYEQKIDPTTYNFTKDYHS